MLNIRARSFGESSTTEETVIIQGGWLIVKIQLHGSKAKVMCGPYMSERVNLVTIARTVTCFSSLTPVGTISRDPHRRKR